MGHRALWDEHYLETQSISLKHPSGNFVGWPAALNQIYGVNQSSFRSRSNLNAVSCLPPSNLTQRRYVLNSQDTSFPFYMALTQREFCHKVFIPFSEPWWVGLFSCATQPCMTSTHNIAQSQITDYVFMIFDGTRKR